MEVINDSYQDFGAGQFIWRVGDPKVEGYVVRQRRAARRAGGGVLKAAAIVGRVRLIPTIAMTMITTPSRGGVVVHRF